jgi:hypothetical protein
MSTLSSLIATDPTAAARAQRSLRSARAICPQRFAPAAVVIDAAARQQY